MSAVHAMKQIRVDDGNDLDFIRTSSFGISDMLRGIDRKSRNSTLALRKTLLEEGITVFRADEVHSFRSSASLEAHFRRSISDRLNSWRPFEWLFIGCVATFVLCAGFLVVAGGVSAYFPQWQFYTLKSIAGFAWPIAFVVGKILYVWNAAALRPLEWKEKELSEYPTSKMPPELRDLAVRLARIPEMRVCVETLRREKRRLLTVSREGSIALCVGYWE